ncbi:MAG: hypothetical protein PHF60_03245 [Candidatus ainarchaeum sp.]|nr:hypothetical protein [Candidatus ainarchaeum sp.]
MRQTIYQQVAKTLKQKRLKGELQCRELFEGITSLRSNIRRVVKLLSDDDSGTRTVAVASLLSFAKDGHDISCARSKLDELMASDPDEAVRGMAEFVITYISLKTAEQPS